MNNRIRFFLSILFLMGFTLTLPLHAQEDDAVAPEATEGISQGDFAVQFARKLGLWAGISRPLTNAKAITLLTEIGVTPFGGWTADKAMTPGDLARMIVQALNELDEIDDAEEDNPNTTAYMDFLKMRYDLDIPGVDLAATDVVGKGKKTASGEFGDNASTNPLETRGEEGELDELTAGGLSSGVGVQLTSADVEQVLLELAPSQGSGAGGRVDSDAANTTPSAPTP